MNDQKPEAISGRARKLLEEINLRDTPGGHLRAIQSALTSERRAAVSEIAAFLRREADVSPNAFLKVDHALLLASVKQLADRIEAKFK